MRVRVPQHGRRRRLLLASLLLTAGAIVVRGAELQILEAARWESRAIDQQRERLVIPGPRGGVYDRNGVPLAASQMAYRVALAPGELRDPSAVARRLRATLGLSAAESRRAVDRRRRWVVLPGRYDAVARQELAGERGIYFEQVLERFYPHGGVAAELLGRTSGEGRAQGGLELAFDSILSGRPGMAVRRRDVRGGAIPGSMLTVSEPVPGRDIYLTIDLSLQEIAHEALRQAVEQTGSLSGELLLVDPETGEILAAVSRRAAGRAQWGAVLDPYEPGSTLKPFFVAALLAEGRATLDDSVYAEDGRYRYAGRTVTDVHGYGWLTVREALTVSSNVAMVKLSDRLDPAVQYGYLRDFGFGTPAGVPFPAEAGGVLRRPKDWSRYSQGSLAIGYEIGVTPLQMVMAYGALANGGVLMEPRLVREVRSRDGRVVERFAPRAIRRVVSPETATALSATLVDVVETGTGREAGLGAFQVAGKTGTARRFVDGRYDRNDHTASFAGFFPADDPQLAFLVKLDRPQGDYYGGVAAAPVMRATLAAALAARGTALDRRVMAVSIGGEDTTATMPPESADSRGRDRGEGPAVAAVQDVTPAPGPFIFALGSAPPQRYRPAASAPRRPVPDVVGLRVRDAATRLHRQGFRVEVDGTGPVAATSPAPGSLAAPGVIVRLRGRGSR